MGVTVQLPPVKSPIPSRLHVAFAKAVARVVMLTKSGVKLRDLGLAKLNAGEAEA